MTGSEIDRVKAAVLERDGKRCRDCGMSQRAHRKRFTHGLHVHRLSPGSVYSLAGCVTVCNPCHRKRHMQIGHWSRLPRVTPLGRRLLELRLRKGLSMLDLWKAARLPTKHLVVQLERGLSPPPDPAYLGDWLFRRLASALDTTANQLKSLALKDPTLTLPDAPPPATTADPSRAGRKKGQVGRKK